MIIMNREELEKMFDERFTDIESLLRKNDWDDLSDIREFIFETIIPEVLKSVTPEKMPDNKDIVTSAMIYWNNNCIDYVKNRAKELYNITL